MKMMATTTYWLMRCRYRKYKNSVKRYFSLIVRMKNRAP